MNKVKMVEGHDGSGKSSIGEGVSKITGAEYRHFYDYYKVKYDIEPLSISNEELISLVIEILDSVISEEKEVILDRGLITPLSVLPKSDWEQFRKYFEKIDVVLCYADLETTIKRLKNREIDESEVWDNEKWLRINKEIAEYFDVPILITSNGTTLEENINIALEMFQVL